MHKVLILTSALAVIAAGGAAAQDASAGRTVGYSAAYQFGTSDGNSSPVPRFQTVDPNERQPAPDYSAIKGPVGYSAAFQFGTSDGSNNPTPRFQTIDPAALSVEAPDYSTITGSVGYSAASRFGNVSDGNEAPVLPGENAW